MQPNSRLLIRFTLPNGDMKGWGYDYPYYQKVDYLRQSIKDDFRDGLPDNVQVHLFYLVSDKIVQVTDGDDLADKAIDWLNTTGQYNGD